MTPNDIAALEAFKAEHPGEEIFIFHDSQVFHYPAITFPEPKRNPDAHLGAEEKPYTPLVDFRHYGGNSHSNGKGTK